MFTTKCFGLLQILLAHRARFPFWSNDKNGYRSFGKVLISIKSSSFYRVAMSKTFPPPLLPLNTIWRHVRSCARLMHRRPSMPHRNLLAVGRENQPPEHRRHEGGGFCSAHRRSIVVRRIEAVHTTSLKCQFPANTPVIIYACLWLALCSTTYVDGSAE